MQHKKIKVYIAGKVSGEAISDCTMKFGAWQKAIESMGFEAVNPLSLVNDWHTPWDVAMRKCLAAMLTCDVVFLLDDYAESRGALLELSVASQVNIRVLIGSENLKKRIELIQYSLTRYAH